MLAAFRRLLSDKGRGGLADRAASVDRARGRFRGMDDDALRDAAAALRADPSADRRVDALALACEGSLRALGLDPYPVQVMGALALLDGRIAEMRTGEGKTLVAALASFAAAMEGSVHVVTVNPYLAGRDAANVGRLHRFLGLSVGLVEQDQTREAARAAYAADVVYATATQIGFDHLRDGLVTSRDDVVQPARRFAIVDEVDSVLIDEARTPLVISHPDPGSVGRVLAVAGVVGRLDAGMVSVDEKERTATLTDEGLHALERAYVEAGWMSEGTALHDPANLALQHRTAKAVDAAFLFRRDRDYAVMGDAVKIIDSGTGRIAEGRQFGDGLHQALEAKEGTSVTPETMTLASVSIQNLFRGYEAIAGMTGTAASDAAEFGEIYGLEVVTVPPNLPVIRIDSPDEIYRTGAEKTAAVIREIDGAHGRLQPILVGTASVEKSHALAEALEAAGYRRLDGGAEAMSAVVEAARRGEPARLFSVLNALNHEREADVVALAGLPGAITVATAMAGRGTDIKLGGDFGGSPDPDLRAIAEKAGGLLVLGTERLENRRVDDQLRGRSGRQGEPGRSKFFLALDDDLLRVFGGVAKIAEMAKLGEGEAISHRLADKVVRDAQVRLETRHFDIRADLVKFDDVVEIQRREVGKLRSEVMDCDDFSEWLSEIREDVLSALVERHAERGSHWESWDLDAMQGELSRLVPDAYPLDVRAACAAKEAEGGRVEREGFVERLVDFAGRIYDERRTVNAELQVYVDRHFMLTILDAVWREHMLVLEELRRGAGMAKIGGRDPIVEYRTQAGDSLAGMLDRWKSFVVRETLIREIERNPEVEAA